jgi:GH43 family beta-xylosidase
MRSTFHNPVYTRNFPDPFVLKYRGEYWAYGTGAWRDGRWFGVLRSRDLAVWEEVGGALEPEPGAWPCLWAPEVSYHNGIFYLYYSRGDEATMELRVATSRSPAGPFVDSGRSLSHEPFAIDAHVFVDDDGSRHLFYATDYLEHSHVGTGTARVRLADPLTPDGPSTPVTRARYDWQVYDPNRAEKGGVRWHTIEGSFVLKRKGRYYQMFSGGNWQNPSYGVSYAIAERVDTPDEWSQVADGEAVVPILRTLPGAVIGPGHNSVVRGPNNLEQLCVYHRWADDQSGRVMAIDRLDWSGERLFLIGPTTEPQPVRPPSFADFFDGDPGGRLGPGWRVAGGAWSAGGGEATQQSPEPAAATLAHAAAHYVAEVSARALGGGGGAYGVALGEAARFLIEPAARRATGQIRAGDGWASTPIALPAGFDPAAYHLLRVELNAGRLTVRLDEAAARWEAGVEPGAHPLALVTDGAGAAFAGVALTEGWEDLFWPGEADPAAWGWRGGPGWRVAGGELSSDGGGHLLKGPLPRAYEVAVSGRLGSGGFAFSPAATETDLGPLVAVLPAGEGWEVRVASGGEAARFPLPASFGDATHRQLRAVVAGGRIALSCEGAVLGGVPCAGAADRVALHPGGAFDCVRITALPA